MIIISKVSLKHSLLEIQIGMIMNPINIQYKRLPSYNNHDNKTIKRTVDFWNLMYAPTFIF